MSAQKLATSYSKINCSMISREELLEAPVITHLSSEYTPESEAQHRVNRRSQTATVTVQLRRDLQYIGERDKIRKTLPLIELVGMIPSAVPP